MSRAKLALPAISSVIGLVLGGCVSSSLDKVEVPPLRVGDSAIYDVRGDANLGLVRIGLNFEDPSSGEDVVPFKEGERVRLEAHAYDRPMSPLGDAAPDAIAVSMTLLRLNATIHQTIHSPHGPALVELDFVPGEDGESVPLYIFGRGAPDIFLASLFSGWTLAPGAVSIPLFKPPRFALTETGATRWDIGVKGATATSTLVVDDLAHADTFNDVHLEWDAACPFPKEVHVDFRSESRPDFEATRLGCSRSGAGDVLHYDGPDPLVSSDPSPYWEAASGNSLSPEILSTEIRGYGLGEAWDAISVSLGYLQRCTAADCIPVLLQWSEATAPLLPGTVAAPVRQWTIGFWKPTERFALTAEMNQSGNILVSEAASLLFSSLPSELPTNPQWLGPKILASSIERLAGTKPLAAGWRLVAEDSIGNPDTPGSEHAVRFGFFELDAVRQPSFGGLVFGFGIANGGKIDSLFGPSSISLS